MTVVAMTGLEKVAVLLKSMPTGVVDKVMGYLDPRHAGLVSAALAKLNERKDLTQNLSGVLDEAVGMLGDGALAKTGARAGAPAPASAQAPDKVSAAKEHKVDVRLDGKPDAGPRAVTAAVPAQAAAHAARSATPASKPPLDAPEASGDPLRALAQVPADLLAAALDSENTRTASLLMNSLDIEVAGQIYKRLSSAKRKDVSLRFTDQTVHPEELVKRIAQGVLKKCQALRDAPALASTEQGGREKRMAALLRELERAERMDLLTALEEADAELTGRVRALLYQFEDILRMENTSVQKLLSEVDVKSLALALRGAPAEIEAKILANLSKRAQESLREEISLTGTVPPPKVRAARQTLVEAIQRLDQRGELVLSE